MFSAARWRLALVFTAVLVVILAVSAVVVDQITRSVIFGSVDDGLKERVQNNMIPLTSEPRESSDHEHGPDFDPGGYFYALTDDTGQIIGASVNMDPQALALEAALQEALDEGEAFADTSASNGDPHRVLVVPVSTWQGDALLQIGRSTESEHDAVSKLRTILMAVAGGSILPALAGGYLLSGRALRPIKTAMDSQRTFIADASHELRTPVAVVRTNAELLQKHLEQGTLGQSHGDTIALEDIVGESERLGKMAGQMLTLAEADAGKAAFASTSVALNELAEEVARSMRALADAKQVTLQVKADNDTWVRGDRDRLRELLVILLDNAVKYTDSGGRMEVAIARGQRKATITVSDTGCGIPAESLPHVFERFYRVDKARSRESGGTGLGLAIARHIVKSHGGSIRIESERGRGTRVTAEMRLAVLEPQPGAPPVAEPAEQPPTAVPE